MHVGLLKFRSSLLQPLTKRTKYVNDCKKPTGIRSDSLNSTSQEAKFTMPRNLVIFCDGTGNQFGNRNSNVLKLFTATVRDPREQLCYYDPGVGTFGLQEALFEWEKVPAKILGLAFGWGITRNIEEAYAFLMKNYQPNDRIFIFGFSRGAFTARAIAGMVHALGIMYPQHDNLIKYATRLYQKVPENAENRHEFFVIQQQFRDQFSRDCKIHFLGLWDTVKSVGWFGSPVSFPYTYNNPSVINVRHALSIDECRCFFRQNLWSPIKDQDVRQVWFAGVHSDVGGGYPESQSDLAKISLEWIACEAEKAGLALVESELLRVLGRDTSKGEFALRVIKANAHKSLRKLWWLAELLPRRFEDPRRDFAVTWRFPVVQWRELGKRRFIREDVSAVHQSVLDRMQAKIDYLPANLPADLSIEPWSKT
jgi:uncharacterized protein (DUF2235 family)